MLSILLDGFLLLLDYKFEFLVLLLGTWACGVIVINTGILDETESIIKYISALCIGSLLLTGITYIISFLSVFSSNLFRVTCYFISLCSMFILIKDVIDAGLNIEKIKYSFATTLLLIFLLIIRLLYLSNILLPGYADSPIHYQIIHQILFPEGEIHSKLAVGNILKDYYHFGYHGLTAWLSSVSGASIESSMSFLGQFTLSLAPLSIVAATYALSKNKFGAFYAGILAALGWIMPAFAVNWGKFPAILALSTAPILVSYIILLVDRKVKEPAPLLLAAALIFISIVIHTRMIILFFLIGGIIFFISTLKIPAHFKISRSIIYSLLFIIALLPLSENIEVYFNRTSVGIILILLLPFAFQNYSRETTGLFIFIAGLWCAEFFLSLTSSTISLLDAQFINILLFIPFSMLGGLALAGGLEKISRELKPFLLFAVVIVTCYNSPWQSALKPDPCCNFYTNDDKVAFEWIRSHIKEEDLFITSTINDKQQHGTDAGTWIYTLTGKNVNKRAFNSKWDIGTGFPNSCNSGTTDIYIYVGGKQYSFPREQLTGLNWTEIVFSHGKVSIFKIVKCQ